jgi:hypothetical protein
MERVNQREPRIFEILGVSRNNRQSVPQQTPHRPLERGKSFARGAGPKG